MKFASGKRYRYRNTEFWAGDGDGFVHVLDLREEPPVERLLSPVEFFERAIALYTRWKNKRPSEVKEVRDLMDAAAAVAKEASQAAYKAFDEVIRPRLYLPRSAAPSMSPEEAEKRILALIKRDDPDDILNKGYREAD